MMCDRGHVSGLGERVGQLIKNIRESLAISSDPTSGREKRVEVGFKFAPLIIHCFYLCQPVQRELV